MLEFKGTPGPWVVKHSESKPAFNVIGTLLGGKYKIARCPYNLIEDGRVYNSREIEESEANARLIETAPEMLNLLIALNNIGGLGFEMHDRIETVISKALTI